MAWLSQRVAARVLVVESAGVEVPHRFREKQEKDMVEAKVKHRVLVIDDDKRVLKIFEELLRRHSFFVTTRSDSWRGLCWGRRDWSRRLRGCRPAAR